MLRNVIRSGLQTRSTVVAHNMTSTASYRNSTSCDNYIAHKKYPNFTQVRFLSQTRPLHGMPIVGLAGFWVAKKTVVFLAASLYGFKRLYRKLYRINMKYIPKRVRPSSDWLLRHTFDATLKFATWVDFRAKKRIEKTTK